MEATHAKEKMLMWNPVPSGDAVSIVDVFFKWLFREWPGLIGLKALSKHKNYWLTHKYR